MNSFMDSNGIERFLGNTSPVNADGSPILFKAYKTYGDSPDTPMLTEAQLLDLCAKQDALGSWLDEPNIQYVHDQDGVGQCNADAVTSALEDARSMSGLNFVKLSAPDLYDRINGGGDNGSMLEDGLEEAEFRGIGTAATSGLIWQRDLKLASAAERAQYRVTERWLCPTFLHCASAVARNFRLVTGISWYSNYEPDNDGWLPNGRGGGGGHAIKGYRVVQRNGKLGIAHVNSWDMWGRFKGYFIIPRTAYGNSIGGWWAIRSVVQEQGDLPILKVS